MGRCVRLFIEYCPVCPRSVVVFPCCHLALNYPLALIVAVLPVEIKPGILLRLKFCNSVVILRDILNAVPRDTFKMYFQRNKPNHIECGASFAGSLAFGSRSRDRL
jgi:hypothetical protein